METNMGTAMETTMLFGGFEVLGLGKGEPCGNEHAKRHRSGACKWVYFAPVVYIYNCCPG